MELANKMDVMIDLIGGLAIMLLYAGYALVMIRRAGKNASSSK